METGHLFITEEAHSRAEASYSSQRGEGSQANQVGQLASLSYAASENVAGKHRTFKQKLQAGFPRRGEQ